MARTKACKKRVTRSKRPKSLAPPTASLSLTQLEGGVRRTLGKHEFLERNSHLPKELLLELHSCKRTGNEINLPRDRSIFSSYCLGSTGYSCVKISGHKHLVHRVFYQWMVVKYKMGEEFNLIHKGVGKEISHKCYSGKRTAV